MLVGSTSMCLGMFSKKHTYTHARPSHGGNRFEFNPVMGLNLERPKAVVDRDLIKFNPGRPAEHACLPRNDAKRLESVDDFSL